jgi:hypothetical protein
MGKRPNKHYGRRYRRKEIPLTQQIHRRAAALERFYPMKLILARDGYLSAEHLANALKKSRGQILPTWLNEYLIKFLLGKNKRRKGRPQLNRAAMDFLLAGLIEEFESKRVMFARVPKAQRNEDPRILAAQDLIANTAVLRQRNLSARRLVNLFSDFGYLRRSKR